MNDNLKIGDIIKLNDNLAVIVAMAGDCIDDQIVPDEHVALWYGGINQEKDNEVWTVPGEYCHKVETVRVRH
ncbi:hypothetical protein V0288_00235 [Pannus brasiliensis CCIBt3594]|uniref:Uncharacterized protein n=1 Tax=Pannus brasiliensis CCIBt3594 TaxID=1427578 RepID=A0AAW9QRR7_9CHRO